MADIKDRAREYIAEHSEYSEVFGKIFVAVDTMTAMVEFAEQETKELKAQIEKMKCCGNCKYGCIACGNYLCELLLNNCNSIPFHCDKWEIKENAT